MVRARVEFRNAGVVMLDLTCEVALVGLSEKQLSNKGVDVEGTIEKHLEGFWMVIEVASCIFGRFIGV